ncbi:hypothetical protein VIGAN_05195200 [Vigna angularis var. angularis]|uniref:Uncharacterized protein n=1 Tax=Vigna angularis var. angularis TaxID=157739 RepID=A0A0S3S6J4_PHAAN|nr:hypothetical protein VIGAN_05195200 [Vigna angularis var. angularis]
MRHRDELLTADDVPPRALQAGQTVIVEQPIGVLADVLVPVGDSMPGSRTLWGFGICTGEASNICECVCGFEPLMVMGGVLMITVKVVTVWTPGVMGMMGLKILKLVVLVFLLCRLAAIG